MEQEIRNQIRNKVEEAISNPEMSEMNGKLLLFTSNHCPSCIAIKELIKEEIEDGTIREINIETENGMKEADKYKILSVPTAIFVKPDGSFKECEIKTEGDDILIECEVKEEEERQKITSEITSDEMNQKEEKQLEAKKKTKKTGNSMS